MQKISNQAIYIFIAALGIVTVYLLSSILTPFLFGALLAYLCDPLVKRLEKKRVPHLLSVLLVFSFLVLVFLLLILLLVPLIQLQITTLVDVIPQVIAWVQDTLVTQLREIVNINTVKAGLASSLPKAGGVVETILKSGYTMIAWTVNLVLIPVVTFYLLRDWDKVLNNIKKLLPNSVRPTIIKLAQESDEVLGAFFRGQLLVMLALGLIYGIGLTLVGLQVGLMIGLIGGLLSIVPYLGSLFVVIAASLAALVQFGTWDSVLWMLGVFLVGQAVETYILTPYLVGERIGLHPVAVIFSVMAGGTLFGFFGVLVALPAAALIKVLLRFIRRQYHF